MLLIKVLRYVRKRIPGFMFRDDSPVYLGIKRYLYLRGMRPFIPAETSKAMPRRLREGFFNSYCRGRGLDVGYGGDPVTPDADVWDFEHGDAQYLEGKGEGSYDFVYSSHTLEHVLDAGEALRNWYRVLKPGGYLILYVPHRDLYEKKERLPSRFNPDHKRFFLPDRHEAPDTVGLLPLIEETLTDYEVIYCKVYSEGSSPAPPEVHPTGEYSIEVVLRKNAECGIRNAECFAFGGSKL